MRLIAFVTASPLFAFEMNVPCQASPESRSSVRSGARARYAETWPASAAIPACWKLVAPLRTVSASRWPWMSSVWRSWMRSAGRALLLVQALAAAAVAAPALVLLAGIYGAARCHVLRYWVDWNYPGLEAKELWPAFRDLTEKLRGSEAEPRVAVEYSAEHEKAGSIRM